MAEALKEVVCWEVPGSIPEPLLARVMAALAERGEASAARCEYVSRGPSVDAVLEDVTDHLAAEHGLKSFIPEMWFYVRKSVRDISA